MVFFIQLLPLKILRRETSQTVVEVVVTGFHGMSGAIAVDSESCVGIFGKRGSYFLFSYRKEPLLSNIPTQLSLFTAIAQLLVPWKPVPKAFTKPLLNRQLFWFRVVDAR